MDYYQFMNLIYDNSFLRIVNFNYKYN